MIYSLFNNKNYSSSLLLERNAIEQVNEFTKSAKQVLLVIDDKIINEFHQNVKFTTMFKIKVSEEVKNFSFVEKIIDILFVNNFQKDDYVISLGGGVVSDLVGFTCSIYKRGIKWINIPSTTLAMVDASIGGKNALNYFHYKNQIGSYYFPEAVIIDCNLLTTLPQRQFYNGLCEAFKMGLTLNRKILCLLEDPKKNIEQIIFECIKTKDQIVREDPFEEKKRFVLNFGHTVGHALETLSNFNILHGEAVLLALPYVCAPKLKPLIVKYQKEWNINYKIDFDINQILEIIKRDKKNRENILNLVYLEDIEKYKIKKMDISQLKLLLLGDEVHD